MRAIWIAIAGIVPGRSQDGPREAHPSGECPFDEHAACSAIRDCKLSCARGFGTDKTAYTEAFR